MRVELYSRKHLTSANLHGIFVAVSMSGMTRRQLPYHSNAEKSAPQPS